MRQSSVPSQRNATTQGKSSQARRLAGAVLSLALCACSTPPTECPALPSNLLVRPKPLNDLKASGTKKPSPQTEM